MWRQPATSPAGTFTCGVERSTSVTMGSRVSSMRSIFQPSALAMRLIDSGKPMWPTMLPSATPASNCSTVVPTPCAVMTVGPNGERSLTREASMRSTRRQIELHMTMSASSTKPGLMPVPRMLTPCSLASASNRSAHPGSLAHGYESVSAMQMTLQPALTAG